MDREIQKIQAYIRAANYLSVTQIYLQDNFLSERPLSSADIKPKLFGHWGTCPGINLVYGHTNYLLKKHKQKAIFVLGPGHGMPGLLANLFLEGTLNKYYKKATRDVEGIGYVSKMFAWPHGFSSHATPEVPGTILEGGELGYSLASAYGAVLDQPDLLAVCLIGDGEAETGPIATAWHINKLVDPKINGAVLPILHVNGSKISGPTIFGRMSDSELTELFSGYGYEPFFVKGPHLDKVMFETLEKCYQRIQAIQKRARTTDDHFKPRFPMIILQTPKGMTTVKELRGQPIEGTILSHQVVMPTVRGDEEELKALEEWLKSYRFEELFDKKKGFSKDILDIIPEEKLCMGDNQDILGKNYIPLVLPAAKTLEKEVDKPGRIQSNGMRMAGYYLKEIFALNKKQNNFRLMSPDETYSNRLDNVFDVTSRGFVWPHAPGDKDITRDGRVMEILSEHNMHGLAQGYVLTGRHTAFTTYEAFAQIISSMAHAYQKFLKYALDKSWRKDLSSMNYFLTSVVWRQEHNGYSHQNPSFVSGLLEKHNDFIKAYYPVDDNSMLAALEELFASKNQMNVVTAGKTPEPRWLTYTQAKDQLKQGGISTWKFASDENPHIVLVGIGDYMTKEALAAIEVVKQDAPEINIRFVNISRLQAVCSCPDTYHPQIPDAEKYFTVDKPVIVNFHGYPETMQHILFKIKNPQRFSIHGYQEWGGTTTPFDMLVRNKTDRYNLALDVIETMSKDGILAKEKAAKLKKKYQKALADHYTFITKNGCDPVAIENWQWQGNLPTSAEVADIAHFDLLKNARTIAFVGLSDNPERHSHIVAKYFQKKGFRIIPINPKVKEVLGEKAYPDLLSIPKAMHIDIIDIFRKPNEVIPHMQEIVERGGIKTVWLADGVNSPKAEDFARDYGLSMVTNFCIMHAYKEVISKKL
jgi:xylulose-5-phosphate/fructose-6-phosphate phosphoketolase